jgi:transcriptional regulator GlxA family with amidase domain
VQTRQARRHRQIVDRFEAMARANLDKPRPIAQLCELTAVSPRTLARAFRAVHGTTPSRYLQALRLAEARRVLLSADAEVQSVTQVAMRFGFRELGRFAVHYRATFGESPSETLRRANSNCAPQR